MNIGNPGILKGHGTIAQPEVHLWIATVKLAADVIGPKPLESWSQPLSCSKMKIE